MTPALNDFLARAYRLAEVLARVRKACGVIPPEPVTSGTGQATETDYERGEQS